MDPVRVPAIPAAAFPLPPRLEGLRRLAYNLYWAWHPRTRGLWSMIDRRAWTRYRNPILVISGSTDWSRLLDDAKFLAEYHDVLAEFDQYMANGSDHWFQRKYADALAGPIAYFCAEYGLHESLGIYSGGLGVLAGDHMKSASDMALPALGVGLLYRKGYFRQTIDADGHQEHAYPDYDLSLLPLSRVQDQNGLPLTVTVELPDRALVIAVWLAQVGRVPVLLLDTDLPENPEQDRPITHILYVRGREMRLHQELVLGVGGVRAIRALGLAPAVWHLNEGHSAFLLAERARERVAAGAELDDAWATVRRDSVFTIHTPVSAGNERFDAELVRRVAGPLLDRGGVPITKVLELGVGMDGDLGQFDMTAFSLRLTNGANAVSQLHAADRERDVARHQRPGHPRHHQRRPRPDVGRGADRGPARPLPRRRPRRPRRRHPAGSVLGADRAHPGARSSGTRTCARSASSPSSPRPGCAASSPATARRPSVLAELETALDPSILTIGFARRFATYKRSGLLFTELDRLERMLRDPKRPIQVVFAGKAHPADRPGQKVIQEIFQLSRSPGLRGRVFIVEDYDMQVARFLVQGADVWLNNPRRPLEASGTSGMKAAQNGVPNVSVLDGWWDEGYTGDNGWAIGGRDTNPDETAQDWADAQDLYRILEEEIVPAYYDRDESGVPTGWVGIMRRSMATALWRFSTTRMLHEYTERLYLPAAGVTVQEPVLTPVVTEAG